MKPRTVSSALAALIISVPLTTHAQDANDLGVEGRYVGETIFESMDAAGRGKVHMGEIEQFRESVFAGMDYDGNGKVTYEEFASWDPGFVFVAEDLGRKEAYTTASKIVFAFWDRNGNGALTEREMRFAMTSDFRRADLDDDALLTKEEFINGFPIMVAMRAAIRPDL